MRASWPRLAAVLTLAPASAFGQPASPSAAPGGETAGTEPVVVPAPAFKPYFAHASVGFNVYTYVGASGKTPSSSVTPADKAMLFEQVGVGYWVHPHLRLQVTGMFGETLSGLKPGATSFTLAAVIPWAVYTDGPVFVGAGPLFAPRAFGTDDFHVGVFTCGGYAFGLGHGLTLAAALQVPIMFEQRFSVAVTPALVLGYRF